MTSKPGQVVAFAVLGVLVILLAGAAMRVGTDPSKDNAGPLPSISQPPLRPRVLFFGDSIAAGCCATGGSAASRPNPTMVSAVAKAFGWIYWNASIPGTGWMTSDSTSSRRSYVDRVEFALAGADMDVAIFQGSSNDKVTDTNLGQYRDAINKTLDIAQKRLPRARFAIMGPYSPNDAHGDFAIQRRVLRAVAEKRSMPFIDPIGERWMEGHQGDVWSDGFHPNSAGQALLGKRLAADLRKAGFGSVKRAGA